jgi:hypothetical protein
MPTLTLRAHKGPVFRHVGLVIDNAFREYVVTEAQAAELRRCIRLHLLQEPPGAPQSDDDPAEGETPRRRRRRVDSA